MNAYIARQPIYDYEKHVVGYELLYRSGRGSGARIIDGDAATRDVLYDAVNVFGLSSLTNHLPAHINFTRNLLLNDFAYTAKPEEIVVGVLGGMEIDDALIAKLGELKRNGYTLALDDYDGSRRFDKITHFFDIIRLDIRQRNWLLLQEMVDSLWRGGLKLLAERVETFDDFHHVRNLGFELFQGYFFEKPVSIAKKKPPLSASSYGQLMYELSKPDLSITRCADIIRQDVVLTYLLLRQMQTAFYYRGNTIQDIREALVMMGTDAVRRWVCMVLLKQNSVTQSDEQAKKAYLRGVFIERLITDSTMDLDPGKGLLMGMLSLLDQIMGVRLEILLGELDTLDPAVRNALLGKEENDYSLFLQYAIIWEMGNERLVLPDIHLRMHDSDVFGLYMECIRETDAVFAAAEGG